MRSHDILGIHENASLEEIERAYSRKLSVLKDRKNQLTVLAFAKKAGELDTALEECTVWQSKSAKEKLKGRLSEANPLRKSDVRLMSTCIGPCTFVDVCCGMACDGSTTQPSCCEEMGATQAIPLLCDGGMWAMLVCAGIAKCREWDAETKQADRMRRAQYARNENVHLTAELGTCLQQQTTLSLKVQEEMKTAGTVRAFANVFATMGADVDSVIVTRQENAVAEAQRLLNESKVKETQIRNKISQNDRDIAAAR